MLLEAKDIWYGYKKGSDILRGASLQVAQGEVVGLFGSSGCGKSTLSKILAGRLRPRSGEVLWDGKPLPAKGYLPVQMIYQHPEQAINPRWRLGKTMREAWDPPASLIQEMGIEPAWEKRFPTELSGGELQRFCVIRALAPQTRILICDEMTTMLDVVTQAQIWELVMKVAKERNMGLVVITHNEHLATHLCDRIVEANWA